MPLSIGIVLVLLLLLALVEIYNARRNKALVDEL